MPLGCSPMYDEWSDPDSTLLITKLRAKVYPTRLPLLLAIRLPRSVRPTICPENQSPLMSDGDDAEVGCAERWNAL